MSLNALHFLEPDKACKQGSLTCSVLVARFSPVEKFNSQEKIVMGSNLLCNADEASSLTRFVLWLRQFVMIVLVFIGTVETRGQVPSEDTLSTFVLKKLSLEELMDIQVTSVSKRPEKLSDAASAIQVITGEDIRRSGASSIPEALRLANNLQVARKGSHSWAISARGFNTELANKLLVLIDGRTVYTPLFSGVFWDRQDYLLEDVDRIEVISGPGSTLWGANAVNGVINIITKKAKDGQGTYLTAGGGSKLQDFVGMRYGGTLAANDYFRVYGKYFDRSNEFIANGGSALDAWRMGQAGFRIDVEPSPQNKISLYGDFYIHDENLMTGGKSKVNGGNVLGKWTHTFLDESDLSLQLYYDRTRLTLSTPASLANGMELAPPGTLKDNLDTYDLDFQHRFLLGEHHHIVWGFGYRFTHDVVGNSPGLAFLPSRLNQNLYSGFVQDEINFFENLSFTLGTKIEHNGYTGFEFEPGVRIAWALAERHTIWAAVSRAIRAPSRVDRDERLPTPAFSPLVENLLVGGADFISETVVAYELGYRAQLSPNVSTSIGTFYNDYNDLRSTSFSPPPALFGLPLFFENNLEGKTYGFEFSGNFQALDRWRLYFGYNFFREVIHIKPGKMDFNNALNETSDPRHQVMLRSSMDVVETVELDAALRWVDILTINNAQVVGTVPSYFELDVRLGWHITSNVELSIVGQNLLHNHHPEYGFPGPSRGEIGRSAFGKIACNL